MTPRSPKRTISETYALILRLKTILLKAAPQPLSLAMIREKMGGLDDNEVRRLLDHIDANRLSHGHYEWWELSREEILFAREVMKIENAREAIATAQHEQHSEDLSRREWAEHSRFDGVIPGLGEE